jgi:hypothetical protein
VAKNELWRTPRTSAAGRLRRRSQPPFPSLKRGIRTVAISDVAREILQRTLSAAYKRADYFARNMRTIQVLIDRDSILTGAAAGGEQPWKYYDLGDGYCSYDFFAKCPHRLACARCPFYIPKDFGTDRAFVSLTAVQQSITGDRP